MLMTPLYRARLQRQQRRLTEQRTVKSVAVAALAAGLVVAGMNLAAARPTHDYATLRLGTGDTLWGIAARMYPDKDPRQVVGEIESINHLSSAVVVPGQVLSLPQP